MPAVEENSDKVVMAVRGALVNIVVSVFHTGSTRLYLNIDRLTMCFKALFIES